MYGMKAFYKKFIAGILAASVLFIMMFSVLFIAEHADHDCTGDDCPVCACLQQCEMMFRGLETGMTAGAGVYLPLLFLIISVSLLCHFVAERTPVAIKVRLNN